ncbi:putative membrane protein [Streptomyces ambofaciens ATCC 23877]|uniref:Putative membrane protein n=1 Tax=Streptomyces ambofaciens (strain ATCC 23877 / 3486 / DSM 40053 / JCM 4204 / NBRC 12836 / NRRL B-2516) TaxID=278992 RepID=A0A0K2B0L9_STRA7|nr:putative membrane protein [Streptomyces ambofaciens ATCC 23877]
MNAEASPVRRSAGKRSAVVLGGVLTFTMSVGAVATLTAAVASTFVDSVLAKRFLWVTVAVAVAVGAGVWRAGNGAIPSLLGSDHPRYDSRAGSAE